MCTVSVIERGEAITSEDSQLLRRVAEGDAQAYRTLVDRHLRGLHAFAYRMLGGRAEAEEVAQEAFTRLWQKADTLQGDHAQAWLYRVAHNLCIDRLRRRREAPRVEDAEAAPPSGQPTARLEQKRVATAVRAAVQELPDRQRSALLLVHYQGLSQAEAASALGVGVRALESLLARARQNLRQSLSAVWAETIDE